MVRNMFWTKYGNVKVKVDGILFDSEAERDYYLLNILPLKQAGLVKNIKVHPSYLLQPGFEKYGRKIRKITYKADFEYLEKDEKGKWRKIVVDVKGHQTAVFKLKRKLFDRAFPNLPLKVVKHIKGGIFIEI